MERKHGGDIYSYIKEYGKRPIDFSSNINPLGISKNVKKAYMKALKYCDIYPDPYYEKLREALGEYENIKPNYIFCGNGAAEIIFRIIYAIKPKKALLVSPDFSEYEKALTSIKSKIYYHVTKENEGFILDESIIKKIDKKDIVIFSNPNNPTGNIIKKEVIKKILEKCVENKATLLIDECFIDFTDKKNSSKHMIKTYDNLIILKAFTKIFAITGIKFGYAITKNENLIKSMYLSGNSWNVSTPACFTAMESIKETNYIKYINKTIHYIEKERGYLIKSLNKSGFKTYDSKANYVFFYSDIKNLDSLLKEKNILIRDCSNYEGLSKGFYRIAVRKKEENRKLIKAFKDILQNNISE